MYTIKEILKMEVALALGCTEPVAVALAAASAASLLDSRDISSIKVSVDKNLYKNALAVSIPGTDGLSGIELSAALGALSGSPEKKLEVLSGITENNIAEAKKLLAKGGIDVSIDHDVKGIYVYVNMTDGKDTAECEIRLFHNNISMLKKNGVPVEQEQTCDEDTNSSGGITDMERWLTTLELSDLIRMLSDLDDEDIEFIRSGVSTNMRLADYGMKFGSGLGIGKTFEKCARTKLLKKDMSLAARILTSAASDARMSGASLPAMSSAGSGNHGLTAVLPIWSVKDFIELEDERTIYEAIALSHLVTAYIKAHTGRLSAICGCSVAAGAGAAAGITYMLGGTANQIAGAIINHTNDLAGVICDGAKAGCSLKLATAAGTAVTSSLLAIHGVVIQPTDGIVGQSAEMSMKNIGTLSSEGMVETDRTILNIMLEKHFNKDFQ